MKLPFLILLFFTFFPLTVCSVVINQPTELKVCGVEREFSLTRHTNVFQIRYSTVWIEWILHVVLATGADNMKTGDFSSLKYSYSDLKVKSLISLAHENSITSTKTGLVAHEVVNSVKTNNKNKI